MQGEKGLKQALKRFHHFRELLLTQCGQSEIKWAKNNWKSKFAPAGWQQRVFDVCWRHSWTCNCQCMSWNCITIVSQKVEGGQKEFVGVRWYNKYNIPPFTVTVCCFGVLVILKSRAIGLFTFAKYGRCSCSFSKACTELYYVVLSCFYQELLPFVMCFAGPRWLHFMPPCPERLMLRSIFATWYFGLQNFLPSFTQENKVKYCKTLSISGDRRFLFWLDRWVFTFPECGSEVGFMSFIYPTMISMRRRPLVLQSTHLYSVSDVFIWNQTFPLFIPLPAMAPSLESIFPKKKIA